MPLPDLFVALVVFLEQVDDPVPVPVAEEVGLAFVGMSLDVAVIFSG